MISAMYKEHCQLTQHTLSAVPCRAVLCSLGCIFARSISMLLVFRVLQGAALGAYRTTATGVVSDVWCPAERGVALGIQALPTLVGKCACTCITT